MTTGLTAEADDVFDLEAARYDAWYDTPLGEAIFAEEVAALRPLLARVPHPWLDVGVGSGRFAAALGVAAGLDPASGPLHLAARRGVRVVQGVGEALPFADARCGAILLVMTLCFVADPVSVLREARRVLRPGGGLVLGLVLAESPWGQHYQRRAAAGDRFYGRAHFLTRAELTSLLAAHGFAATRWRSALRWPPAGEPTRDGPLEGDDPAAGFTAVLATAQDAPTAPP